MHVRSRTPDSSSSEYASPRFRTRSLPKTARPRAGSEFRTFSGSAFSSVQPNRSNTPRSGQLHDEPGKRGQRAPKTERRRCGRKEVPLDPLLWNAEAVEHGCKTRCKHDRAGMEDTGGGFHFRHASVLRLDVEHLYAGCNAAGVRAERLRGDQWVHARLVLQAQRATELTELWFRRAGAVGVENVDVL